jgi:hypothetical protein
MGEVKAALDLGLPIFERHKAGGLAAMLSVWAMISSFGNDRSNRTLCI